MGATTMKTTTVEAVFLLPGDEPFCSNPLAYLISLFHSGCQLASAAFPGFDGVSLECLLPDASARSPS